MPSNNLNSFRITVILVVFVLLCYVDWSPDAKQRSKRSPLSTRSTIIHNSCINNGEIGVTFDEGPTSTTKKILEILKRNNIKATFHLNPSETKNNQEIAKVIVEDGHTIGLSLDTNLQQEKLNNLSVKEIKEELDKEAKIIKEITGVNPKFLRLPYELDKNNNYLQAIEELGFIITNSVVNLSGESKVDKFVKLYEDKLKENYNKDKKIYPKFIDRNQDGLSTIPEAWEKIIKLLENYNANPVTLDVCTGTKESYRTESAANPKTISSISAIIISTITIIYFLI